MNETISVRDHSRTCEHGSLWSHWVNAANAKWWQEPECLGGSELTLRRVGERDWTEVEVADHESS